MPISTGCTLAEEIGTWPRHGRMWLSGLSRRTESLLLASSRTRFVSAGRLCEAVSPRSGSNGMSGAARRATRESAGFTLGIGRSISHDFPLVKAIFSTGDRLEAWLLTL
jgi:hypothetical protein